MESAKTKTGISSKVFTCLDQQTVKDGRTCQISTHDDDSDMDDYHYRVIFRCELSSAQDALQILEQTQDQTDPFCHRAARALRNEAAIAGGVWSREASELQQARVPHITTEEYPRSNQWNVSISLEDVEYGVRRIYVPVFRTADISVEVCCMLIHSQTGVHTMLPLFSHAKSCSTSKTMNAFTKSSWDAQPDFDLPGKAYTMAFVTSLEHPFHSGPAFHQGPENPGPLFLTAKPVLPDILLGATAQECDILTRHYFLPAKISELECHYFIIMDELTEQTKTVLLACNNEFDGELQLLRSNFTESLLTLLAPESTALTMHEQANDAAKNGQGVSRLQS